MARPELLDLRAGWGGGKPDATTFLLEPLPASETERLVAALLEGATIAPLAPDRVTSAISPPQEEPPRNADPRGSLLTVRASYTLPVPLGFVGLPRFVVTASATRRIEWMP